MTIFSFFSGGAFWVQILFSMLQLCDCPTPIVQHCNYTFGTEQKKKCDMCFLEEELLLFLPLGWNAASMSFAGAVNKTNINDNCS